MSDFQRPAHSLKREVGGGGSGDTLFSTLVHLWPYIWPADRRDLKVRVGISTLLIFAAKLATIAVPFTFKWATDALAGHGTAPLGPDDIFAWALATPVMMTRRLWRHARGDGAAHPVARRDLRQGVDERGAPARHAHVRARALAVAALSSGAPDRRAHARPAARARCDRNHCAHAAAAARADHRRGGSGGLGAVVSFRLAIPRHHRGDGRALHRIHLLGDRVAHRHPPRHEFERQRRQRQGDRLAAQLRDRQIFLRRGTRGAALRPFGGAL